MKCSYIIVGLLEQPLIKRAFLKSNKAFFSLSLYFSKHLCSRRDWSGRTEWLTSDTVVVEVKRPTRCYISNIHFPVL